MRTPDFHWPVRNAFMGTNARITRQNQRTITRNRHSCHFPLFCHPMSGEGIEPSLFTTRKRIYSPPQHHQSLPPTHNRHLAVGCFLYGRSVDGFVFTPFRHSIKNSRRHCYYPCEVLFTRQTRTLIIRLNAISLDWQKTISNPLHSSAVLK